MISALLIVLICLQPLSVLFAIHLLKRWVAAEKRGLESQLRGFVESPAENEPSPLAVYVDQFALLLAGRIWQQIEARLRGAAGTAVREANQEAEAAVSSQSPLLALAMAFLPKKVKATLANSPQFVGALANMVGGRQNGGGESVALQRRER